MASLTQVTLTCDVCGNAKEVQTRTLGLDGQTYEADLCSKDSKALTKAAAAFVAKARRSPAAGGSGQDSHRPRARAGRPARAERAGGTGKKNSARGSGPDSAQQKAKTSRAGRAKAESAAKRPAAPDGQRKKRAAAPDAQPQKGVFVYGIFPEDIEVAEGTPGVGENPGQMRAVRSGELAALVSDVDPSGTLGSPDDLRIHQEILDACAPEMPVLALPFGTVLASEEAVAAELLAAHHDEFARALKELDGRMQFVVEGRYLDNASTTSREEDASALDQALGGHYVASVAQQPADELAAVRVSLLVDGDQEGEVERVIEDLTREWDGRIELQLLGPMAAYDFVATTEEG